LALAPWFRTTGLTVTTFTLTMAALSALCLFCAWRALRATTRTPAGALLMFAPFITLAFYRATLADPDSTERTFSFDYFALGPLRLLMPLVVLALFARQLERPTRARRWTT